MKKIPLLLGLIALATICHAQINWGRYSQTYTGSENGPRLYAAIPKENNAFWTLNPPSVLKNDLEASNSFMKDRTDDFFAITTFDNQPAHFFVSGGNIHYEFRVLKDNKEIVQDWTPVTKRASEDVRSTSTIDDLMYIGAYNAGVGHYLVVDIRRKGKTAILNSAVVAWRPVGPELFNIYTVNELNEFLQRVSHPDGYRMTETERSKWRQRYANENLDEITSLPKKMTVEAKDNNLIFMLRGDIRAKEQVEYELVKDNQTLRAWGANEFDNNFIWLKDLSPGDYRLRIRYAAQPANTLEYNFQVKSPPGATTFIIGISSLIAAFLALVVVLVLYLRQKRRTKKELLHKQMLELEMKGLKSQLNPHFVFNSLNSIQGLVNTGRIREANEYIAVFAKLMRTTLALSEVSEAPLQQEIDYLNDYLKLEQLRFNFEYDIAVDPSLPTRDVNFPTLLLQPLVENAVKHGITANGKIVVRFEKKNNDLVVTVQDNGKGFDMNAASKGYGLHLVKQRIKLLNDVSMAQLNETSIQLIFKSWLNEA